MSVVEKSWYHHLSGRAIEQKKTEIPCRFTHFPFKHGEKCYGCCIEKQIIPENQEIKLHAKHWEGRDASDVVHIQFEKCTITKIPQGLKKIFPNLKNLVIYNSKLKKISRSDLIEYKNIRKLLFENNDLEFLPGDLFEGFEYLNFVSFFGNKLGVIEPNILDGLDNLRHVSFSRNLDFNKLYSIYPIYEPNATLQEVKNDLNKKYFSRFKFLQDLKKCEEELKKLKLQPEKALLEKLQREGHDTLEIIYERTKMTMKLTNLNK